MCLSWGPLDTLEIPNIYTLAKQIRLSGSLCNIRGLGYPEKIIHKQQLELIRYGQFLT